MTEILPAKEGRENEGNYGAGSGETAGVGTGGAKQLELLEHQREYLLGRVHTDERRISCLDYLIYQIRGKATGKRQDRI